MRTLAIVVRILTGIALTAALAAAQKGGAAGGASGGTTGTGANTGGFGSGGVTSRPGSISNVPANLSIGQGDAQRRNCAERARPHRARL
jgi:hypothetical protein